VSTSAVRQHKGQGVLEIGGIWDDGVEGTGNISVRDKEPKKETSATLSDLCVAPLTLDTGRLLEWLCKAR
jgi:hypothetical protein